MDVREKASSKKRLIDAKEGKKVFSAIAQPAEYKGVIHMVVPISEIDKLPTVDAVPVVRCRECMHWKPTGSKAGNSFSDMEYIGGCEFTNYCRRESDFCSYGERKDSDGNG